MVTGIQRNSQPHFFKYTSFSTAVKVIASQAFRWSSPIRFNDPFDHQTGFAFPFTGDEFAIALNVATDNAVFGDVYAPLYETTYSTQLARLRRIRDRLPRAEIQQDLRQAGDEIAQKFPANCDALNAEITAHLTNARVLCLTETMDNVVMWSHYSDEHRGVVFKLRRLEERDHRFIAARRVTYTTEPVSFLTVDEYVEKLLGLASHDLLPRAFDIAFRKHSDWSYEREWRVWIPLLNASSPDGFSYFDEPKELFEAIYLGCRMEAKEIEEITRLAQMHLPGTAVYRASKSRERIALEFARIA